MTESLYCLVGWAAWAIVLVLGIACVRVFEVMTGKTAANGFTPGIPHGGDRYWRLNRAHVNTLENLPIFGALIVTAHLAQIDVATFAKIALGARVIQSLIHVSSGTAMAVNFRFTAFVTQVACFLLMVLRIGRVI
jgi:hypothetical protein